VIGVQVLNAQEILTPAPIKRTLIFKKDLEGIEGKEMHVWVTEFAPGETTGNHYHPWHEFAYVLEGAFTIEVQAKPPVTLKPGERQPGTQAAARGQEHPSLSNQGPGVWAGR